METIVAAVRKMSGGPPDDPALVGAARVAGLLDSERDGGGAVEQTKLDPGGTGGVDPGGTGGIVDDHSGLVVPPG